MTFSPVVPISGIQGWQFLSRTMERQKEAFSENIRISNDSKYFRENISKVNSADSLVRDRRLLNVALTAFGLEDDIDNKFLIKKVLEDGSLDPNALGNRFSDKRYLEFSKAFGFGDFSIPNTLLSDFSDNMLEAFLEKSFEAAIGEKDESLRLAMSIGNEISKISSKNSNENSKWFMLLGNPPLRSVFEGAFRFSKAFGALEVDRQVEELKNRSTLVLGVDKFHQLSEGSNIDRLRELFLLSTTVSAGSSTSSRGVALQLLKSGLAVRY